MTSSELERYYRILELEPGATLEQINQAYKDLVFVWHPDRLPKDNPRLQHKAQEKLKLFNEARDKLRSLRDNQPTRAYSPAPQANKPSSTYSYPPHTTYQQPQPNSDLSGKDFSRANLSEADLSHSNLNVSTLVGTDLIGATLVDIDLSESNLTRANLIGANLYRANLCGCDLIGADLRGANCSEAYFIGADLSRADLSRAEFTSANLSKANFSGANTETTDFQGAILPDVW